MRSRYSAARSKSILAAASFIFLRSFPTVFGMSKAGT